MNSIPIPATVKLKNVGRRKGKTISYMAETGVLKYNYKCLFYKFRYTLYTEK